MNPGWRVYSGVVHVHTDRSGGAPFETILEAARECGVDFVVLTDTNIRMEEARALEGWHDDVLVLVGEQVVAPNGSFLAFDVPEEIGLASSWQHGIERVHSQAGSVVGTHYHFAEGNRPSAVPAPLPVRCVDLVELWSFHDEFVMNARGKMAIQFHTRPDRLILGPAKGAVEQWDRELRSRSLPAVGSVNALARKDPLLDWKEYFDARVSFKMVRTNVLCPVLPKNARTATATLWRSIRRGYSYLVNYALGDPAGFDFYVRQGDRQITIGETVPFAPGGRVHIQLPESCELILWLNGAPLFWGSSADMTFPAPVPGVYRLEVRKDRRTWIVSNAIRLLDPEDDARAGSVTVYDFT